ncbi:tRNA (cytosine-5-)-methyltransferase ncl1 [Gnomoniopsis smithogilvyi]|uniref:tRNA (Cytosine-5-)-methyltransferase ncl1 n=1 Tax=Gnomoniopsis smithogilvyi TaxID=1191159 RepID=A0A9W8YUL9_9PEZI|nr:tRNA (cytosine-5-)-methyltransferase ncl1 [Gnomoniopsis smithogilvyi]
MGRNKRGRGRGGSRGGGGGRGGSEQNRNGDGRDNRDNRYRADVVKERENLERYYNELIQLPEEEKAAFWEALRRELPNSFRFCGSKGHAVNVKRLLEERYIPEISKMDNYDGNPVTPPLPVPWYPDNLAWWMTTPKNVIRRYPPFAKFQKFLVSETSVGNISRQEVVSMIPPLLLDVKPGHTVLDLCAAPGSKAAQLLEMLHTGEEGRILKALQMHATEDGREIPAFPGLDEVDMEVDPSDDGRATGMLIANDMDYKRSHLLIHQLKRLSSPNMIVTNHDATLFPSLRLPSDDSKRPKYLKFDRILADVPCSGDGTMRKNVAIWNSWIPGNALGLHQTQIRILSRALQMLKPGGRVVYSTCSMNPVENESVVASAIERCGDDSVEIVDCSNELPGLKRTPGMTTWKVMDKSNRIWNSWEEVEKWAAEHNNNVIPGKVVSTMFPRSQEGSTPVIPLERCIRVYAHQQDTGGFFIVALHKKKEFKLRPENWAHFANKAGTDAPTAENGANENAQPEEAAGKSEETEETKDVTMDDIEEAEKPTETDVGETKQAEDNKGDDDTTSDKTNTLKRPHEGDDEQSQAKRPHTDATPVANGEQTINEVKPGEITTESKPQSTSDGYGDKAAKKQNKDPYEEPFKYLAADNEVITDIQQFYKVSPRFPADRFMVRNAAGEPSKAIYYTSGLVRDVLSSNEGRNVKFVHGGVKMFMKQDAPSPDVCRWRIQSEGMPILQGYVGPERVVVLRNKETLRRLLVEMFPRINDEEWKKLDEVGERVRDMGKGCLVLRVEPDGSDKDFSERMALPLWKSFHSLNLMLPKEDRAAMLLRVYNDTTPLVNTMLKDQKKKAEDEAKEDDVQAPEPDVVVPEGTADVEDITIPDPDAEMEGAANGDAAVAEEKENGVQA